ncbi:hypothetical protein TNCV_3706061 [Trichonephila clavipes]|nr:hypothetical protein TNCV_3706061 [Trichonephila clavipes]
MHPSLNKRKDRNNLSEDDSAQKEEIPRSIDENNQTKYYLITESENMQGHTLVNDWLELSNLFQYLEDWIENMPVKMLTA